MSKSVIIRVFGDDCPKIPALVTIRTAHPGPNGSFSGLSMTAKIYMNKWNRCKISPVQLRLMIHYSITIFQHR